MKTPFMVQTARCTMDVSNDEYRRLRPRGLASRVAPGLLNLACCNRDNSTVGAVGAGQSQLVEDLLLHSEAAIVSRRRADGQQEAALVGEVKRLGSCLAALIDACESGIWGHRQLVLAEIPPRRPPSRLRFCRSGSGRIGLPSRYIAEIYGIF